jgi:hypothetical protein
MSIQYDADDALGSKHAAKQAIPKAWDSIFMLIAYLGQLTSSYGGNVKAAY